MKIATVLNVVCGLMLLGVTTAGWANNTEQQAAGKNRPVSASHHEKSDEVIRKTAPPGKASPGW